MNGTRRSAVQRTLALVALGGGLLAAYWLHFRSGLEWEPSSLRGWFADVGPLGPVLFVGLMAVRPLVLLPSWVLLSAAGILFGTLGGAALGAVGGTLGALLAFGVARVLGREAVERHLTGSTQKVDRYLGRRGPMWLAAFTALPMTPLTPAYYASGLSSMRALPFLVGAAIGIIPRCVLYSFFGDSLIEADPTRLLAAVGLLGLAIAIAIALSRRFVPR